MTDKNFLRWLRRNKRFLRLSEIEKKHGLTINTLSHALGKEARPLSPNDEHKIKKFFLELTSINKQLETYLDSF